MAPAAIVADDVQGSVGANGFAQKGYLSAAVTGTKNQFDCICDCDLY